MKKYISQFLKRHSMIYAATGWISFFILINIYFIVSTYPDLIERGLPKSEAFIFLMACLLFSSAFIFAGYFFLRNYIRNYLPIQKLKKTGVILAERDFPSMARGISNLTLGNLTQKLHLHSQYPPSKVPHQLQPLSEILHLLRDNLNAIIDDFNSITDAPCKRIGFIGADPVEEGRQSAVLMAEMLKGKGQVLIATGLLFNTLFELRRKSFQSAIEKKSEIKIVDTFESMMNRDFSMNFIEDLLESYPKLKGIYATDATTASIIAEALSSKSKYKKIKVIGHDITRENTQYMQSGILDVLLDQNPYIQGHDSAIYLYNHLVEGWIPPKPQMLIAPVLITQENLNQHWNHTHGWILAQEDTANLVKPSTIPPTKPYRIVFLAREDTEIWDRIHNGFMAAKDELAEHNINLEWLVPDETREKADFSAMVYGKQIDRLISEKVDGIITFIEDPRLIASINKAVKAGIPVMTVYTEPLNLRSLIHTLDEQAYRLSRLAMDLAGTTQHVIISTTEIRNSISNIADGSMAQNNQVEKTRSIMDSLLNSIDQIDHEANESERASENTRDAVAIGTKAMEKTLTTLNAIAESVNKSWNIVEDLREHSNKIDNIVNLISTIASKVNILALNASIEATQSGTHEKRFGKVASEIRKLAMKTTEANREVASLIETIKMDIQLVEKSMRAGTDMIQDSEQFTGATDSALENIRMLVDSDKNRIESISHVIHEMQSISHQVGLSMDRVAMASTKNTDGVNQVTESIKEMEEQLENVRALARNLEQMSESESEFLAMFETNGKAD